MQPAAKMLDLDAFQATALAHDPYDYLIVPGFLKRESLAAINADYPKIDKPGSFPSDTLDYGAAFAEFLDELAGPACTAAFSEKFGIDLARYPTTVTVRGMCQQKDGRIHTDTKSKIITVLVYMNPAWEGEGGRLRVLRSANDLEDYVAEVPPIEGTLLAFRRSETSFHGHKPFIGPRRVVQLNWVTSEAGAWRETARHRVSAFFKRLRAA
jgi:SM-20-related protein